MEDYRNCIGYVFNLQRMSLHDGPGIRTVIFMKGCNLRCFWCHNPESYSRGMQIEFFPDRCIGCGQCVDVCTKGCHQINAAQGEHLFVRTECICCGKCASICPAQALLSVGQSRSAGDVVDETLRDKPFFEQSMGGVTLSGGEPMLQADFCEAILHLLKAENIDTAMETALSYPFPLLERILSLIDHLFVDFKHPDSEEHRKYTGRGNDEIIDNLHALDKSGCPYTVRIPVIPGVNDIESVFRSFDSILSRLHNLSRIELMPYHTYGVGKLAALSIDDTRPQSLNTPTSKHLTDLASLLHGHFVEFREGAKKIIVNGGSVCKV